MAEIIASNTDIYLRKLEPTDYDALHAILSDSETMYYYRQPFSDDIIHLWLDRNIASYQKRGFGLWAVVLKTTDEVIGDCGLTLQNIYGDGKLYPEIGYHFNKKFWRQGYASQAVKLALRHAFTITSYDEIYSYQTSDNLPSQKTAQKMGMTLKDTFMDEQHQETTVYSITREDYNIKQEMV